MAATCSASWFFVFFTLVYMCGLPFSACNDQRNIRTTPNEKSEKVKVSEKTKIRTHIDNLQLKERSKEKYISQGSIRIDTLRALLDIYKTSIKPLEEAYRFSSLHKDAELEAEIMANPLIVFVGPWSTGKTTIINYLLDLEDKPHKFQTSAEPTTSDFIVVQHGPNYRMVKGMELVSDKNKSFASLEKLGQKFLERLLGVEAAIPLLELVTLVDTPGIIENKKQQERGYPFNEVMQWFLQRASIILLVFDPTKLEVSSELETIFEVLKQHEGKVRILLNKADTIQPQELMKVYGALFWSLAPVVHSVEPPKVYVGSFWSKANLNHAMADLFQEEEQSLLNDINQAIVNQLENKIVYVRGHAVRVRLHALIVDQFLAAFNQKKSILLSFMYDNGKIWSDIVNAPEMHGIFQDLTNHKGISHYDLPKSDTYRKFFQINSHTSFSPLSAYRSFWSGDRIEKLTHAIDNDLPHILNTLKDRQNPNQCTKDSCK